jgi:hypothetical protein
MEIKEIPISKIKPDPNQPRQSFAADRIKEMAQSILTEGIINPIEIDKDFMIITGEMRWRSAKKAGLKTVPCKILEMSKDDRFLRQVIENIHHNTMTAWDTAQSLRKLLSIFPVVPGTTGKTHTGGSEDKGISFLSKRIGKSPSYIREYLYILETSKEFQESIKKGLNASFVRAVNLAPSEHKEEMEKKIIKGEFVSRDGAKIVAQAIKQSPALAKKILDQDYSGCDTDKIKSRIKKVDPAFTQTPISDAFNKGCDFPDKIGKLTLELIKELKETPASKVGVYHLKRVVESLTITKRSIDRWLDNKETKQLK